MAIRITWLPKSVRRKAYREVLEAIRKIDAQDVLVFQEKALAELRRVLHLKEADVRG